MKPLQRISLFVSILFCSVTSFAQVSKDAAVQLEVSIGKNPDNLTLHWPADAQVTSGYDIYRRDLGSTSWGASKKHLAAAAIQYSDSTVAIGKVYEYRVKKVLKVGTTTINAYGYTQSGIEVPMVADHGKIILLVDKTFSDSLKSELARLEDDLWREGWHVIRHDVARNALVTDVKALVVADYDSDQDNTKALFIFGQVPVPYSGLIAPDGHPDHYGAWPADMYYGEFFGDWTDDNDYPISGIRLANQNIAGDGKFDISTLAEVSSTVDLMIGRVDLSNMGSFAKSEGQLLKQYLDKDHNFRTGILTVPARGLIDDNFGYFSGEAFASSGWRNIAPMVGLDSMKEIDWFTTLPTEPYLWAYGTGGGYDQGAGGIGTTQDFAAKDSKAIFTMLFGSYFGDWNTTDNFLRAPLCTSYGLSCAWSGRPYWHFFPMGLGEPIGYCAKLTQNNDGDYVTGSGRATVHIALMGDPTLMLHPMARIGRMMAENDNVPNHVALIWDPSPDKDIIGYYVFRAPSNSRFGPYYLLTPSPITSLFFTDNKLLPDSAYYFVRAVKLETTPSGSYYNLSPATYIRAPGFIETGVLSENKESESLNIVKIAGGVEIILEKTYSSQVKLEIYDASGKVVTRLINQTLSPGTYCYNWQTTSVASGVYFVRAIGLKEPLTSKILVVQ